MPGPREFGEGAEASADDSSSLPSLTERHPGDISTWLGDHQSYAVPKKDNFSNMWLNSMFHFIASYTLLYYLHTLSLTLFFPLSFRSKAGNSSATSRGTLPFIRFKI